jgi:hypothetical protein
MTRALTEMAEDKKARSLTTRLSLLMSGAREGDLKTRRITGEAFVKSSRNSEGGNILYHAIRNNDTELVQHICSTTNSQAKKWQALL